MPAIFGLYSSAVSKDKTRGRAVDAAFPCNVGYMEGSCKIKTNSTNKIEIGRYDRTGANKNNATMVIGRVIFVFFFLQHVAQRRGQGILGGRWQRT